VTSKLKQQIKKAMFRANNKCWYCGLEMNPHGNQEKSATIEHILPRCHGGTDEWHNLTLTHKKCNNFRNWIDQKHANVNRSLKCRQE
jgi:5-methylcytosine-specific restriction endonuclease McrA